jgi:hypothetical protein
MAHSKLISVAMLLLAVMGGPHTIVSAADRSVLTMQAFAVDMSGMGSGSAGPLDITVERWSTDEERDRLRSALIAKGGNELMSTLRKLKPRAGYIRGPSGIGWNVHFARQQPTPDGGHRIILAAERPMSFWELWNRPRSADYEFTLAEIRLDRNGKGEGKLVPAAKVSWNKEQKTIEITNYGTEPVRLTRVQAHGTMAQAQQRAM